MAWEYLTYPGNGEVVRTMFNAVATLSGSSTIAGAAQAASLFGFLAALAVGAFKLDLRESFNTILGIFFVWMGIMTPKTQVLISESAGYGFTAKQYTVANVPLGLALTGSMVSQFGHYITRKTEQTYSLPNDLAYSRTGMIFGSRLYEKIYGARINDPVLLQDWALFMHQCSFFDLNMYRFYTLNDVRYSDNLIDLLGRTNVAMFTNVTDQASVSGGAIKYKNTSTTMSCKAAHGILKTRTQIVVNNRLVPDIAARVFGTMTVNNVVNQRNALQQLGNQSFQYLLNDARFDTLKNIEQAAMANLIRDAGVINDQRINNTAAVQQAFATAQARNQYITAQRSSWWMASENLPVFRGVVEAILIGLFPIMVVVALLGGILAFRALMFYFAGMLWIQLWAPVASIMNLVMTVHAKSLMSIEAAHSIGITAGNSDGLLMAAVDAQSAAAGSFWLIPVIAAGVAMGGRSLVSGFMGMTGMLTTARGAAERSGSELGTGNVTAGNMSYNNASANKQSLDPVYTSPALMTGHSATGTTWSTMTGGASRYQARNDSLPISAQSSIKLSDAYSRAAEQSITAAQQQTAAATESMQLGTSQTMAWAAQYGSSRAQENGYGLNLSASDSAKFNRIMEAAKEIAQKHGLNTTSQVASTIAGNLGLNGKDDLPQSSAKERGGLAKVLSSTGGIGWSGSVRNLDQLDADISSATKALQKDGVSFDQSTVDTISQSAAFKQALTQGDSLASQAAANFGRSKQASLSAQESYATAQSYQEKASRTAGTDASVSIDNARAVKEFAQQNGMTMEEVYRNPSLVAEAALGAAAGNVANLKQAASGTPFSLDGNLSPDTRPTNSVASAHAHNLNAIEGGVAAAMQNIEGQAAQVGIRPTHMEGQINQAQAGMATQFAQARTQTDSAVGSGKSGYSDQVDHLHGQMQQMGRTLDSVPMRINSKQYHPDTKAVQEEVRSGRGYAGGGYDNVFANTVDNPALKDSFHADRPTRIVDMPGNSRGSGSATFFPKD